MFKILLCGLCTTLCMRAITASDGMLACYWFLVGLYWMINFVEGIHYER